LALATSGGWAIPCSTQRYTHTSRSHNGADMCWCRVGEGVLLFCVGIG
jgi:hypothetical protein